MRRAVCFFVVREEYQGGILHAAGDGSDQLPR